MTSSRDFLRGYFTDIINDKGEKFPLYVMFTSTDFMKMLGLKVKEGQIGEIDSYEHYQIALNETAMKTLGYDTLEKRLCGVFRHYGLPWCKERWWNTARP